MDLDLAILVGFVIIYFLANFFYKTKPISIDHYSSTYHKFSTTKIIATLLSLWIASGISFYGMVESYQQGLCFILPSLLFPIALILVGIYLMPRVHEFLGKSSLTQIVRELWGNYAALITACCYITVTLGILAVKIRFTAGLLEIFCNIPQVPGVIISASAIFFYCIYARIKLSMFDDIVQFATISCILPISLMITWDVFIENEIVWHSLKTNQLSNFFKTFSLYNPQFYQTIVLSIFFLMPRLGPLGFVSVTMSHTPKQCAWTFKIIGLIILILDLVGVFLVLIVASTNQNLNPNYFFDYLLVDYSYTGLRGLIYVGILILTMSISNFLISDSAVMLARECLKPLGLKAANNETLIFNWFTVIACITSAYISLKFTNMMLLLVIVFGIYQAIVSTPFVLAILGFRSSGTSVLIGMIASITTMLIYQWKFKISGINFFIPGTIANFIFLFGSHYLLKQPDGWIGIKGLKEFKEFQEEKRRKIQRFIYDTFSVSFLEFCKQGLPTSAANISFFGAFSLVSIILTQISLIDVTAFQYNSLLEFIYPSAFIISINLIFYPVWPHTLKKEEFLSIIWLLSVLYLSIIIPSIFAFATHFLPMQMIIALIHLIAIFVLLKWNIAIFLILIGALIASFCLYCFVDGLNIEKLQLQMSYLLLLLSGLLISFLKPQKDTEKNQEDVFEVSQKLHDISEQTLNLLILKQDILNSLNQEIHTPIANIGTGAINLNQNKSNLEKHNQNSVELVYTEYKRLQAYVNKLVDLSKFEAGNVTLNYQDVNFEELVENAINQCKNSNLKNFNVPFHINTQATNLITTCDPDKIFQCLEYLIMNAINFTTQGTIEILLDNQDTVINETMTQTIKCSIIDEGIGIPEDELEYIFETFTKSSYTQNSGKGLGLALCQRIVRLHYGIIWAENNKTKPGAAFTFMIPRRPILG